MNANKQLINLIGIVVVVAILVAGVALIALPMWSQSRTTDASTRTVAQTNAIYEAQVTQLTAAKDGEADLDRQLAELRADIPDITKFDDVFEIVNEAVSDLDLTIQKVSIAEDDNWAPRVAVSAEPAVAPDAATAEGATDAEATEPSGEAADPSPAPAAGDPAASAQRQAAVTIEVAVPDAETATKFIDALGKGPRLLSPLNAALDDGTLTLTVLTFFRTED